MGTETFENTGKWSYGELLDGAGYPRAEALGLIGKWNISDDGIEDLLDLIRTVWWYPARHFELRSGQDVLDKPCWILELHTGGWSGNESVIEALGQTTFWWLCWLSSRRGGHFEFEIPLDRLSEEFIQRTEVSKCPG